jgi:WXG100 family type VII secretion target
MAIVYNYAQMQQEATKIDGIKANFDQLSSKMDQIVGYANKGFDGESLRAFQTAHANVIDQYKTMGRFLTDLAETIRRSQSEIEARDMELAQEVKASFSQYF